MKTRIIIPISIIIGFAGGYLFKTSSTPSPTPASLNNPSSFAIRQSGYHYINPLLECENSQNIGNNKELTSLKDQLEIQINQEYQRGTVTHVALYFRDLNNGPWFGVNENSEFTPASLLKTPMMMAYLKLAESDPAILSKKLFYDAKNNPPESPTPTISPMQPNSSYSVEELISRMITYSDNNAFNLLTLNLDYNQVMQVHNDLGLTVLNKDTPQDFVTVKQYAGLFRVLYNSSYLSRSMSEKALSILSQASYHNGLVSGLREEIEVAHKYGVRHGDDGIEQLHDCGIVYYPGHPYLFCIMTKGRDFKALTSTISHLSRVVFDEIDQRYGAQ